MATPRAMLFDLHDTLVHLMPSTEEALAAAIGVELESYRTAWRSIDERIERGAWFPSSENRWIELYGPLVDALDLSASAEEVAGIFSELFMTTQGYVAFPDVAPALQTLHEAGFQIGVLSNSDFALEPILEHCGLAEYVQAAVPVVSHGTTKPDPKAFALGADALRVSPEHCWFIGDRLIDDVAASAAAGMRAVLVDRVGRYAAVQLSFPVIGDLSRLPALVGVTTPRLD